MISTMLSSFSSSMTSPIGAKESVCYGDVIDWVDGSYYGLHGSYCLEFAIAWAASASAAFFSSRILAYRYFIQSVTLALLLM